VNNPLGTDWIVAGAQPTKPSERVTGFCLIDHSFLYAPWPMSPIRIGMRDPDDPNGVSASSIDYCPAAMIFSRDAKWRHDNQDKNSFGRSVAGL
jgi:hypothetical protein